MDDDLRLTAAQAVSIVVTGDPSPYEALPCVALDMTKFHSGRWALELDRAFARRERPAVLVAQGVACLAVAWWAQLSPRSYMRQIAGAVFVSPLSTAFGQESLAAQARSGPATKLAFPSIVVNAAYPFVEPVLALADSWGSCFVESAAPEEAHPSNRHGGCSKPEEALIALLRRLDGAPTAGGSPKLLATNQHAAVPTAR